MNSRQRSRSDRRQARGTAPFVAVPAAEVGPTPNRAVSPLTLGVGVGVLVLSGFLLVRSTGASPSEETVAAQRALIRDAVSIDDADRARLDAALETLDPAAIDGIVAVLADPTDDDADRLAAAWCLADLVAAGAITLEAAPREQAAAQLVAGLADRAGDDRFAAQIGRRLQALGLETMIAAIDRYADHDGADPLARNRAEGLIADLLARGVLSGEALDHAYDVVRARRDGGSTLAGAADAFERADRLIEAVALRLPTDWTLEQIDAADAEAILRTSGLLTELPVRSQRGFARLARSVARDAMPAATAGLDHHDPRLRRVALAALAVFAIRVGEDELVDDVLRRALDAGLIEARDAELRADAIEVCGRLAELTEDQLVSARVIDAVLTARHDRSDEVRAAVDRAIARLERSEIAWILESRTR